LKLYSNNNIFQNNKSLNLFKDVSHDNISKNIHKIDNTLNFENNNLNNISISILNPNKNINKDLKCNFFNYNNLSSNIINNNFNSKSIMNNFDNKIISLINNNKNNLPFNNYIYNQNEMNSSGINNININNIRQIYIDNNNIQFFNSLNQPNKNILDNNINNINFYTNNIIEKNNLNNNIFSNNINYNNIYINKNNFNLKDNNFIEFSQYIESLPIPLINYLCTSKGIMEIQKKLIKSSKDYKLYLIIYLNKEGLSKIMKNTYGNYFFQQLIKDCEKDLISLIINYISDTFVNISKDYSGTFSLQALLDEVSSIEDEHKILSYIKYHELEMAYDKNATHVLQKLILLCPDTHRIELNQIILNNLKELCIDSNGICLVKNFIRSNTLINDKKRLNQEFVKNLVYLAVNPFGNYGIQFLIENWDKDSLIDIKNKVVENIFKLSLEQFSSNVVEKAIELFDEEYREKIIRKLCFEGNVTNLLKSKFGRFVLYKAINYMKSDLRNEMETNLINNMNNKVYSNKDKNKIKKLLMKLQSQKSMENKISDENNKCLFYNNTLNNSNSISEYNKNNTVNQK
jgi:hypothetical protein